MQTAYTILRPACLESIKQLSSKVKDLDGAIAEIGIFKGGTLAFMASLFKKKVYGFDTFEGLPAIHFGEGEYHKPLEFNDTSLEYVSSVLESQGIDFELIKGVFPYSCNLESFAFVHLDVDYGKAIKESLEYIYPRLVKGGIIVIDDYDWAHCSNVKPVVDDFFEGKEQVHQNCLYQAYIIKK